MGNGFDGIWDAPPRRTTARAAAPREARDEGWLNRQIPTSLLQREKDRKRGCGNGKAGRRRCRRCLWRSLAALPRVSPTNR